MANNSWSAVGEPVTVPEIKSSRCVTFTKRTATLSLEVTNYPQLESMGVGECVMSPKFRACGYDWGIVFYPNGYTSNDHCAGYTSAYLNYLSQPIDVIFTYTMSLQGKEGQAPVANTGPRKQVLSPGRYGSVGYPRFVERSELKWLSALGGSFTIRCVLVLEKESSPLELPGRLERMLGEGTGADVTFRVGGRKFEAHTIVLAAQSPVFHAQFFGPMIEKDIEVIDVDPTIFEMLLRYIYTDSLPPCQGEGVYNVSVMQHLLVAADRYGVDRLRLMCEEQLCDKINMDTVKTMLALANQHNCQQLKDACLAFMASPQVLGAILETDGFKEHFMMNCRPLPLEWAASGANGRPQEEETHPS